MTVNSGGWPPHQSRQHVAVVHGNADVELLKTGEDRWSFVTISSSSRADSTAGAAIET
jgi:hypothetical protein